MIEPSFTITGSSLKIWKEFFVYAWVRGDEWLYVGRATQGSIRISSGHHVINARETLLDTDKILVWRLTSLEQSKELETILVMEKKPKYNYAITLPRRLRERYIDGDISYEYLNLS